MGSRREGKVFGNFFQRSGINASRTINSCDNLLPTALHLPEVSSPFYLYSSRLGHPPAVRCIIVDEKMTWNICVRKKLKTCASVRTEDLGSGSHCSKLDHVRAALFRFTQKLLGGGGIFRRSGYSSPPLLFEGGCIFWYITEFSKLIFAMRGKFPNVGVLIRYH